MPQRQPQRFAVEINALIGDWRVLKYGEANAHGAARMLCRCERCGTERLVVKNDLASGRSRGDGCYRRQLMLQSRTKTGDQPRGARSITAKSLRNLRRRYGDRVVPELRELSAFIAAVGERPSKAHHLRVLDTHTPTITASELRWELRRSTTIPKNVARAARRVAEAEARANAFI